MPAKQVATLARTERGGGRASDALPSTLEQLLGDRLRELPGRGARGRRLARDRGRASADRGRPEALRAGGRRGDRAPLRARSLRPQGRAQVDFRHPLTRDVAYAALRPEDRVRMHRELGEHLAQTSLARGLSAAIVARHLARGESYDRAAKFYFEAAIAARDGPPDARSRSATTSARCLTWRRTTRARSTATRRSRARIACSAGVESGSGTSRPFAAP